MKLKWIASISVLLVISVIGFIFWYEASLPSSPQTQEEKVFFEAGETAVNGNSPNDVPLPMKEQDIQQAIHNMSHQKVRAVPKWGSLEITPERINGLISVVENSNYKHSHVYLDILYGWKDGDFSEADKDHNTIWHLQGGTIGEATGLLSVAEEDAFIRENFE